ncbi:hypothetical protein HC256_001409 [Beauveria bassiana]|nr:hypothetical protein HC256_001409 [Beauveria bassiana]
MMLVNRLGRFDIAKWALERAAESRAMYGAQNQIQELIKQVVLQKEAVKSYIIDNRTDPDDTYQREKFPETSFDTVSTTSTTANDTRMMNIMTTAIAIYTTANNGRTPSTESISSMIDLMEPPTDDNMITIGRMIKEFFIDPEGLTSFLDNDL